MRRPPGARCPTCAGTRRWRCGRPPSSWRAPTSAAWRARPTTPSSTRSRPASRPSPTARGRRRRVPERTGLLVDWGGVLTTDVFASFRAFCAAEGLAVETVRDRFREDAGARGLLAGLETGALTEAEFAPR